MQDVTFLGRILPIVLNHPSSLALEWVDFEGKARQRSILRHRDHREPFSFAGHLWRVSDAESGRLVAYFKVLDEPTRVDLTKKLISARLRN